MRAANKKHYEQAISLEASTMQGTKRSGKKTRVQFMDLARERGFRWSWRWRWKSIWTEEEAEIREG